MSDTSTGNVNIDQQLKEMKFLQAVADYEAVQKQFVESRERLNLACEAVGIGKYVQSSEGLVHKVVVPKGTFTYYYQIGYVRTKRADEDAGTLSVKEAKAAGFTV